MPQRGTTAGSRGRRGALGVLLAVLLGAPGCGLPETEGVEAPPVQVHLGDLDGEVQVLGDGRIGAVGGVDEAPLEVRIREVASGAPIAQVPVEFLCYHGKARLIGAGEPAERLLLRTDRDGRAVVRLKTPSKPADVTVRIQIRDPEQEEAVFEVKVTRYAVDPSLLVFQLLGGLALFLFGMKLMTTALQAIAGERLRGILESLTRRRLMGLAAGAGITAVIQSSSATTVMVVGLVNAGLLTLHQAVPVMFGANIGTTITAQLIAFRIADYAYPMLFLGLLLNLTGSTRRRRHLGEVLFGLGMLFVGMEQMGAVFKPLSKSAEFKAIFVAFSAHPVLGVLAGTLVTVLVQSSSATVGLCLTLARAGLVDFQGAFALILGDNIGTTITALLASLSARPAAKRAAAVHTLFNLCGALVMLLLLPVTWGGNPVYLELVDRLTPGTAFGLSPDNLERHVANSHAFFNVLFAVLFLPLSARFADLATWLIPGDEEPQAHPTHLADNLLETPSLALRACRLELYEMARVLSGMFEAAMRGFQAGGEEDFEAVLKDEFEVDRMRERISHYLVEVSQRELEPEDAERIPRLLHAANDLERFGDLCTGIVELGRRRKDKELPFSEAGVQEIEQLVATMRRMLEAAAEFLRCEDPELGWKVKAIETEVNRMEERCRKTHIKRLREGECHVISGIVYLDFLTILERQGDMLRNVASMLGLSG